MTHTHSTLYTPSVHVSGLHTQQGRWLYPLKAKTLETFEQSLALAITPNQDYRIDTTVNYPEELSAWFGEFPNPETLYRIAHFLKAHGERGLAYLLLRSSHQGYLHRPGDHEDLSAWIHDFIPKHVNEAGPEWVERYYHEHHPEFVADAARLEAYIDYPLIWQDWSLGDFDTLTLEGGTYFSSKKRGN